MKIAQVNLGLLPIPPNSWGAVEKIIWDYKIELEKLGHTVSIPYSNEVEKDMYDIVHVHVWNHALEMYEKGIPYIFTCHDHHLYLNGKDTKMYQDNLRAMRLAQIAFVPAKYLVDYFDNVPVYLEHGVRIDNFVENTPNKKPRLLCVGNNGLANDDLFDRKGFRYAIEAAKKLDMNVTVVGPTNVNKKFFEHNKDLTEDNVTILYDLDDKNLIDTFSKHDILVHATSVEAGHPPLTILEAAASGLPVLTTDCSGDLHTTLINRDSNDVVEKIKYVMKNYNLEREKTITSVKQFDWKNVVKKMNKTYEKVVTNDMRSSILNVYDSVKKVNFENKINFSFKEGAMVEITGQKQGIYTISFIDDDTNEVLYQNDILTNSWAKTNRRYFTNWRVVVTENGVKKAEHKLNLKGKKVLIKLDSNCLGDTIAWFPYFEEFRKKHQCDLYVFTFNNKLFEGKYPKITFLKTVNEILALEDVYASYLIGWYFDTKKGYDDTINKIPGNKIPLQQAASDILGLDFVEIKPKLKDLPEYITPKPYICIATNSTAQAKFWNNPTGWQELVDYVKSKGYDVYLLSKEEDGHMGNKQPNGVVKISNKTLEEIGSILKGSKLFVGLGSGLTWYSWALNVPTILISGFSQPFQEMKEGITRIINNDVCHGCFAKHLFDKGDWNWCPEHKGTNRQFECTKFITFDMVKPHIQKILKLS
jgi:autotransporter strand-loop-strand O-heptosyltransferase